MLILFYSFYLFCIIIINTISLSEIMKRSMSENKLSKSHRSFNGDDDNISANGEFMTDITGSSAVVLKSAVATSADPSAPQDKNSFQLTQNPRRMSTMHSYVTDPVGDLADVEQQTKDLVSRK